jgi:hypothetical protein
MKQLNDLEAKRRESDEIRTHFVHSAMKSLGNGDSKVAFGHLIELIKTSADLKELESAILTLAVSGKLVSQDKKEGTAEELTLKFNQKRQENLRVARKKQRNLNR